MRRQLLPLFFCFCYLLSSAQNYDARLIPDSLKGQANAIKRFEEVAVIIKSASKAIIRHKWAITILNEAGEKYGKYSGFYGKFESSPDISGTLYDAYGKNIRSVKKKDIADMSYNDQISLISDERVKHHSFYYKIYPYTVEYEEEQEQKGIFFLPSWHPVMGHYFAVEQSRFVVEFPPGYGLRYKQFCYNAKPQISGNTYTWNINNLKGIEKEDFPPSFEEYTPSVYISPVEFEIDGHSGKMDSWLALGRFIGDLRANRDDLPENIKQDIHKLTDGVNDKNKKIKLLYDYLQQSTRYISIQLGIGGWQPFEASYVASKHYGDCKALSNYMVSILKEAGIKANYVWITAGEGEKGLWEDFPSPYFNHAIACVPSEKDTLWLECTSQTVSCGFMGSFTGNRKALLIADDGGHIVNTPVYKKGDNSQIRKISATVDESGNVIAEVLTKYTGLQQEEQHQLIHNYTREERDKVLNTAFNLPTYSVENEDYKEVKGKIPLVTEYLKLNVQGYASLTETRLFIQPNILNKNNIKLNTDKPRQFPIVYPHSFTDVDTVSIALPYNYETESLPKNISISNKFGKYSISYKVSINKIDVLRTYEREAATFPPSDFIELAKFYEEMNKADHARIVLVRKG